MSLIQKIVQQDDLLSEALIDPVTKFRVSTPESMIQTDFEYGLQPTKWESIELINNIPVFYVKDGDLDISLEFVKTFENSYIVWVRCRVPHNFVAGSPFVVTGLGSLTAEGTYIVYSIVDDYEFYYRAKQSQLLDADIYDSYTTYLYSARIFSATQYNMDNLIAVETSGITDRTEGGVAEPELSTIKVITQFPHGFVAKSTFMMGNSLGEKNVDFDAKLIDVNGIITETIIINTASNNPFGSGYLTKVINPYEFQSKRTYFIDLADINYDSRFITMSNHSLVTGNFLMYVSPISDTPIGGMQNYKLYYTNVLSPHQIQLSNVEPFLQAGLNYKRYTISTDPIAAAKFPFIPTGATMMDFTGHVTSCYRIGSTNYPSTKFVGGTTALGIIGGTAYNTSAFTFATTTKTMLDMEGYFYTTYTGEHRLKIISNDIAYLWVGSNATSYEFNKNKTYGQTSTIGDSTQTVTRTWTGALYGSTLRSNELILNLTSNDLVPIKVRFANQRQTNTNFELNYKLPYFGNRTNTCLSGCNVGTFTGIGITAGHMDYALTGKCFFYSPGRYETNVGIGTSLGSVFSDSKSYYKFSPAEMINGVATDNYGVHSFHKAYLVNGIVNNVANTSRAVYSPGTINVNYNPQVNDSQGASSASLTKGGKVAIFSGDILCKREAFGLPELASTLNNYGGYSVNNYNFANVQLTVNITPTAVSTTKTVATDNFYPTIDLTLSTLPQKYNGYKLSSTVWIVPIVDVALKNSIYYPSHGISTNDVIIFGNVGWGSLPKGLVSQTPYYADSIDVNYLRIKTKSGLVSPFDINEFTNASFEISRTSSNVYNREKNRLGAYRIYAEGHDFTSNAPVYYYQSGSNSTLIGITKNTLYYICKPYSDSFQLASQKNGPALRITHNITSQEYHAIRSAERGTVDGNYIIDEDVGVTTDDPYTLQFVTKNPITDAPIYGIPYTRKYFNPRSALDLGSNLFYIPDHRLRTGSRIIYGISNNGAGGSIPNINADSSYLTIRIDENRFRLSSINANSLVGAGITSGPFIDAWTLLNNNPMSDYIIFNQTTDVYPYDRNDGGSYHYFDFASIGGDTPYPKPLKLANNCNLITNANTKSGIDFTSVTKLGGIIGIRYADRSNNYSLVGVGTTAGASEIILSGNANNFAAGDAIVYNAPSGRRGIAGLSNNYFYYVQGISGIGTTQTRISYLYNTSNSAVLEEVNYYTGLGNYVGFSTSLNGGSFSKRFAGQIDYYTISDINSKNVVTVNRDIVLPSWLTSPDTTSGQIMVSTGIYPRLDSYIEHRAFNGGVEIVPSLCPFTRITRQTRKYFRYQAGKGIQLSKAVNFSAPVKFSYLKLDTDETSSSYNLLVGKTRSPHRLTNGVRIRIDNAISSGSTDYWNGQYQVNYVSDTDPTIFYIVPKFVTTGPTRDLPSPTFAGGFPEFVVNGWEKDSSYLRVGMFDDQNGIFFEYDGVDLNAVRRNSIQQLSGTANVEYNSSVIIGNNTNYDSSRPYLDVGTMIVIRGVSYKVVNILNDQYMYIQPPYRGVSANSVIIGITSDTKVPSSHFSIDKCDGTGPSGFNFDVHKIQMMYIDFSWYGAGKVRYGFKGVDGHVVYVHEFIHNNIFTEAYMRAGNLPGRYEVGNGANPTFAPALQHWGTSIIMDGRQDTDKEYLFTASGKQINYYNRDTTVITIHPSTTTAASYIYKLGYNISYLGSSNVPGGTFIDSRPDLYDPTTNTVVSAYTLWFGNSADAGAIALYSHLKLYGPGTDIIQTSGTSFFAGGTKLVAYPELVDGYYYMYVDKQPLSTTLLPTATFKLGSGTDVIPSVIPLVSIRLSPSVDNGRPALLGQREVVNRMQLELDSVSIMVSHDCEIQLVLNGNPFYKTYTRLPTPSLTQAIFHEKNDSIQGGLAIYTIRASGGVEDVNGRRSTNLTSTELKNVATLGNSIIGGNGTYPDGPDILSICAKPLSINNVGVYRPLSVSARLSWKEAQA